MTRSKQPGKKVKPPQLPIVHERLVVALGYARPVKMGRFFYDWERIRKDLWLIAWQGYNLREFCTHYGISYKSAKNKGILSSEEKRRVEASGGKGYMAQVVNRMVVIRAEESRDDPRALQRTLDQHREVAQLLITRVHSVCGKGTPDGLIPNPGLRYTEMYVLSRIANQAFDLLRKAIDTERALGIGGDDTERQARIREKQPDGSVVDRGTVKEAGGGELFTHDPDPATTDEDEEGNPIP